jgi:uncharacterized RDD family membrane protein YckC
MNARLSARPSKRTRADSALAPFWRRLSALAVDAALLTVFGAFLGMLDNRGFARLGPWGRLVGFLIAGAYFSLLDGPSGAGRTFGKRLLKIRVVDADGDVPRWGPALRRGFLLATLFAVGRGAAAVGPWNDPRTLILELLTAAVAASVYLTVFERERRQGLHDMAAGTFVARAGAPWTPPAPPSERRALGLAGLLVAAVAAATLGWLVVRPETAPLFAVRAAVARALGGPRVEVRLTRGREDERTPRSLEVSALIYEYPGRAELDVLANRAAAAALAGGIPLDALTVDLRVGYDIGLAAFSRGYDVTLTPAEWRARLAAQPRSLDAR